MPQEPSRLQTSPHRFCARARFTIPILHKSYRYLHRNETSFCFVSGCPTLDRAKKRSIQHRGPQRPHHERQNEAVTTVLQVVAKQKLSNNPLHSSIARPQWLSMGACGPLGPFTMLCIFKSLLNTPKNARWKVHHLSVAGSTPWFCPSQDIDAAQKAPPCVARRGQRQVKRPYAYGRRTTKLG